MRTAAPGFLTRFALVAGLLVSWALVIGRYGGPDEPAHVLRAFAAAHGDLLGDPADPLPPGYRSVDVPAGLASGDPSCYRHDARIISQCGASDPSSLGAVGGDDRVVAATSAGLTPPLYHLAVGSLVRLAGDSASTAWYRVMASLLHALVIALALTRGRHRPVDAVVIAAAITPAAWFLFGVVNPNSLEIALALLCWVGVARFVESARPTSSDAWWVACPAAAAIAIRPIAIVPVVAMLVAMGLRSRPVRLRWIASAPVAAAIAAGGLWSVAVSVQLDDERTSVDRSVWTSLRDAVRSLPTTAGETVTSLGWNEFHPPLLASLAWLAMWVVLIRVARTRVTRPMTVWLALMLATPLVFEVALAGSIGPIWQGRYSLPMLMALPAFVRIAHSRAAVAAMAAVAVVATTVEIVTYWATVRRYAVGTDGSWWLTDPAHTTVGFGPRAWLAVHAVVAVVGLVAAVRSMRREPPRGRRQAM